MSKPDCCSICGASLHHPLASYCRRCKRLVDRSSPKKKADKAARARALQKAWDDKIKGFRCCYSGVLLNECDRTDPRYLTFDHRTPRQEDDIVITAQLINDMKTDMTDKEFREMVFQLARRFNGREFDERL